LSNHRLFQTLGSHPDLIQPFGNYIVIEVFRPEDTSEGGVLLPDMVKEQNKKMIARVIAVGPGQRSIITGEYLPMQSKVGDLVVVMKHAPINIPLGRETVQMVFEGDVLGCVNEERLNELMAQEPEAEPTPEPKDETVYTVNGIPAKVTERESGLVVVNSGGG
jgi:co-chaperonin GroES (HSP10)